MLALRPLQDVVHMVSSLLGLARFEGDYGHPMVHYQLIAGNSRPNVRVPAPQLRDVLGEPLQLFVGDYVG